MVFPASQVDAGGRAGATAGVNAASFDGFPRNPRNTGNSPPINASAAFRPSARSEQDWFSDDQ
jgi:hypothetical protein